jgi:Fibronectin type III domain/Metallo-peptidase family M12B Reprolysin-like
MKRRSIVVAALLFLPVVSANHVQAQVSTGAGVANPTVTKQLRRLKDVIGQANGARVATPNKSGLSDAQFAKLAEDDTVWIDANGSLLYRDVATPPAPAATGPSGQAEAAPMPYSQTFSLHSQPGSSRVIYLDFDGQQIENTAWNTAYGVGPYFAEAFDMDGDPTVFSPVERDIIQNVWQRVAEDYAPFDVDVTTADPGVAAIDRVGLADLNYGTRLLITGTSIGQSVCGCGGQAYLNAFANPNNHAALQPAFVYSKTMYNNAKYIAEAASHEVGHNLSLNHDRTATVGYYGGHNVWAPIMGVGYNLPVTQFSSGEFAGSANGEDDFALMNANGLAYRADDHSDTSAGATPLTGSSTSATGVISTRTDVDTFSLALSGAPVNISVLPNAVGPNLDIKISIRNTAGTVVYDADPVVAPVNYDDALNLGVNISAWVPPAAGTYYLSVDGVGALDPLTTGYSDYGSRGGYTVTVNSNAVGPTGVTAVAPATQPNTVTVQWVPPSPQTGILYYRIKLFPQGGGSPLTVWAVAPGSSRAIYWVAAGTYTATVESYSAGGLSTPSPASAPVSVFGISNAPTGVTAAGSPATIAVSWTPPNETGGAPVDFYRIVLTSPSLRSIVRYAVSSATSYSVTSIPKGTYTATVSAIAGGLQGVPSAPSLPVSVIGLPGVATAVTATPSGDGSITVNWVAPTENGGSPIQYYRIAAASASGGTIVGYAIASAGMTTLTNVSAGSYSVSVAAGNSVSLGADSAPVLNVTVAGAVVTTPTLPGQPILTAVTPGTYGSANVSWTAPTFLGAGVSYYRILVTPSNESPYWQWVGNTTTASIYVPEGTYSVSVQAYNSAGLSLASAPLSVGVTGLASAPGNLVATVGAGASAITATWNPPAVTGGLTVSYYRAMLVPENGTASTPNWVAATSTTAVFYLPPSGSYRIVVEAFNSNGFGVGSTRSGVLVIP